MAERPPPPQPPKQPRPPSEGPVPVRHVPQAPGFHRNPRDPVPDTQKESPQTPTTYP